MSEKYTSTIELVFKGLMLLITTGVGAAILNFYVEWKEDEAIEEQEAKAVMFDDAGQKQTTINHVDQSLSPEDQKVKVLRDQDFQRQVLKELREMDSLRRLDADQIFQTKDEIRKINDHIESDH